MAKREKPGQAVNEGPENRTQLDLPLKPVPEKR